MAMFKTLADLKKAIKTTEGGSSLKDSYLTVSNGESYKIRFLQEITEDSAGYDETRSLAHVVWIHHNPDNFRKSAVCTINDEASGYRCWACEQVPKNNGWKAKQHMFINVAAYDPDSQKWSIKILDQKFTAAHVAQTIVDYAGEYETITDRDYKISRKGEKQKTQYSLIPLAVKPEPEDEDFAGSKELFDLSKVYRRKSVNEQASFYLEEQDRGKQDDWE